MHAYMRMYTQFGCGRSSCYARRGRNGAKGKRACRSACARSRARQSPCRGAGAHGEGPKAPARVKAATAVKVPGRAISKQHRQQRNSKAIKETDMRIKETDVRIKETDVQIRFFLFCFLLIFAAVFAFLMRFFICFLCVFYVFFMCFSCFIRPLRVYRFYFYTVLHIYQCLSGFARCRGGMHHIERVSGLVCRSGMHQRGRSFLTNFSLPAI